MVNDKNQFEVSVVLAAFNASEYIERSINSVLRQSFTNTELIIVDDGSTDNTSQVLKPFLEKYDCIKYLRHSNRGHPLSLNAGMSISSGRYITFIDSDDEYSDNHIRERVAFMNSHPEIDLIHSPATLVGDPDDFYVPDAKDKSRLIHINECILCGTLFGKREVFFDVNGFRNIYSHDSDFVSRVKEKFRIAEFDLPSYIYYRDNPNSVTSLLKKVDKSG